jgi:hypothetical protein
VDIATDLDLIGGAVKGDKPTAFVVAYSGSLNTLAVAECLW